MPKKSFSFVYVLILIFLSSKLQFGAIVLVLFNLKELFIKEGKYIGILIYLHHPNKNLLNAESCKFKRRFIIYPSLS